MTEPNIHSVPASTTELVPGGDPIAFSVIMSRFDRIVTEMTIALERSAWTPILALCKDFSCAVFDASGRLIAMHDALPVQSISLPLVLRDINETFAGKIYPGDMFACNDPFRFNTHIGDFITAAPVHVDGEHLFWVATKGHQIDTGAYIAASVVPAAADVWQEGIAVPPVKFYERGEERFDVVEMYLRNLRYRELAKGDLLAQLGSVWTGVERLGDLCREYGAHTVVRYAEAMIEYADRRMTAEISAMPAGEYSAEGWIDSDGAQGFDVPIRASVKIEGERISVDFSGSGPQGKGGLNGSFATAQAAGAIPFLQYIDTDIPHNDGCVRHIEVFAPEGSICNAAFPASTSAATIVPTDMMMDVVHKAMATAMPDRVSAGSVRCQIVPQFSGEYADGNPWGVMLFNNSGGQGATRGNDGWPLWESTSASGGLKIQSVEQIELLYPLRVETLEIEPDSMGMGESIGGPGTRLVIRPLVGAVECITFGDSFTNPPHGVLGGTPGIGGGQYIEPAVGGPRRFVSASGRVVVDLAERWVGVSSGGGGYGSPYDRDVDRVAADVRDGIVSIDSARNVFGVVCAVSEHGIVDVDRGATDQLRAQLCATARPQIDPTSPSAATWLKANMREGDEYLVNPV